MVVFNIVLSSFSHMGKYSFGPYRDTKQNSKQYGNNCNRDETITDYCKVLKHDPNHAEAANNLGDALARKGNVKGANRLSGVRDPMASLLLGRAFSGYGNAAENLRNQREALSLAKFQGRKVFAGFVQKYISKVETGD